MNDSEISEDDYDPLDELLYFLKTLGKHLKQVNTTINSIFLGI